MTDTASINITEIVHRPFDDIDQKIPRPNGAKIIKSIKAQNTHNIKGNTIFIHLFCLNFV
jgi:hypothetical protein